MVLQSEDNAVRYTHWIGIKSGDSLGPYEMLAPVGEGGMGEVWKARDTRLSRTVAVKVSKDAFNERFEHEARAVAALNHPNICQIYDVGPNYLVMELIAGEALKGPLPLAKAVEYSKQILDALDTAHRNGIVHRDLKPANILVTRQGVKLLDFGLAKQSFLNGDTDTALTQALTGQGQILGTLQYMAPEQLQGQPVDSRSDLFSFGCLLYEMLSGKRAFDGESPASVIAAILEREPAPLDLQPPVERVIRRCLAKDPEHRFQNAQDLKTALEWAVEPGGVIGATSKPKWTFWVIAGIAAITAFSGGWLLSRETQQPTLPSAVRMHLEPPEGAEFGPAANVAVSPDGSRIAFTAASKGARGLWIRATDSTEAKLVAGADEADAPFWSPDGKSLGYLTRGRIMRVDPQGGADPIVVLDRVPARGAAWCADGNIVFGMPDSGLQKVSALGGERSEFTALDAARGETSHRWPQLLPGDRLMFWRGSSNAANAGPVLTSLAKPAIRQFLLPSGSAALYSAGHLLWLRGSSLVAQRVDLDKARLLGEPQPVASPVSANSNSRRVGASASENGMLFYGEPSNRQFQWLDREGHVASSFGEPAHYITFRLSANGRQLAVSRASNEGTEILAADLERNVWSKVSTGPGSNVQAVWSPDARRLLFRANDPWQILFKDLNSVGNPARLTDASGNESPVDWSRDGKFLLIATSGSSAVLTMTPGGLVDKSVKPIPIDGRYVPNSGRFHPAPNPGWLVLQKPSVGGPGQVEVQSFPDSKQVLQISADGGSGPEWSPDGREIYYVSPDLKLMSVSVKIAGDVITASAPRELFELHAPSQIAVSSDGQKFLVLSPVDRPGRPIEAVLNWPGLLKK